MSVRAAERAARWSGAKTKPRTKTSVDPALAARVKDGLQRLTGLEVRVAPGRVELGFTDEHDLEELAESSTCSRSKAKSERPCDPSGRECGLSPCSYATVAKR